MARRYEALLTQRQVEIITFCEERIVTIPTLFQEFKELSLDFGERIISHESLYSSLCTLERRGLVIRNPGTYYPVEWTSTEEGVKARDLTEEYEFLAPTRVTVYG